MSRSVQISVDMPDDLAKFRLPDSVQRRLQHLLDLQDGGRKLTQEENEEAEALVNMAELLTLLRLRTERAATE
jgi:hypothetical protein